jgi:putative spermidine/putrescine transport system ATP-binding protein
MQQGSDHDRASSARPAGVSAGAHVDVLKLDGLLKRFGAKTAIDGVSLSIPNNEYVSLLGPSGSGKTVLLRLIAGFDQPDQGQIHFDGRRVDVVPAHRRGIGFVFQNFALFPHLTVHENIAYGLANRVDRPETDAAKLKAKVGKMIELVGLAGLESRNVSQISGGQRQRVALARTLVTEPRLVLLDEPLGALDANLRERMRGELRAIRAELGVTFFHVTGGESEALAMGDRVIVLDRGRIVQFDNPDTVFNRPLSADVARFLNCYNLIAGKMAGNRFAAAIGDFPVVRRQSGGAEPAYAIRHDLIRIQPSGAPRAADETGIEARFITSEYSGASVQYFFALPTGTIIEVENHLSHRKPEQLEPQTVYALTWGAGDAIVFA